MSIRAPDNVDLNPDGEDEGLLVAVRESQFRERAYTLLEEYDENDIEYYIDEVFGFCATDMRTGKQKPVAEYADAVGFYADPEEMPDADLLEEFLYVVAKKDEEKEPYAFDQEPSEELLNKAKAIAAEYLERFRSTLDSNAN